MYNKNNTETKCSHVTIIGSPNAGKSTLLNNIIGNKISIISPKPQTTRNIINGIYTHKNSQLIFIDTPGIFTPNGKLEHAIVRVAWRGVNEAEQIILLIDSKRGICENTKNIIKHIIQKKVKIIAVLNKIDIIKPAHTLTLIDHLKCYDIIKEIFIISALSGEGVNEIKDYLADNAQTSPWLYPEEEITTMPSRFLACELVREKLFLNLEQELPYNIALECENWIELKDGSIKIHLAVYVTRSGQKKIIIGKNGILIKKISQDSRIELEKLFERKIHLFLFIKVRENWIDNPDMLPN